MQIGVGGLNKYTALHVSTGYYMREDRALRNEEANKKHPERGLNYLRAFRALFSGRSRLSLMPEGFGEPPQYHV